MKLFSYIALGIAAASLASCDAVYEDLDPCPTGVDLNFAFTRNILGTDAFLQKVHCTDVHVYNDQGMYMGTWSTVGSNHLRIDLPAGSYHAVAYGGMNCEDASFVYNDKMGTPHSYPNLTTSLKSSRAAMASSSDLHPHFHAAADFVVEAETDSHTGSTLDFTKNTNNIRVVFQYEDKSHINPATFNYSVVADNATMAHDNSIISGNEVTYTPHATGTFTGIYMADSSDCECAYADLTIGRLTSDMDARLKVNVNGQNMSVLDLDLVKYFNMIRANEMRTGDLQNYLDCQDTWTLLFMLDPNTNKVAGLVFKVNNWVVNLSNTSMDF